MQEELSDVANHIKELGLAMLSHSLRHTLQEYFVSSDSTSYMNCLGVIQAAHACEILIKARIAEEDPLLIFSKLPKSNKVPNLKSLAESGKTFQYSELPKRLLVTTGHRLEKDELMLFQSFGKLRNSIQHFTKPQDRDLTQEAIEFIFGVIEPLINTFWGLYASHFYVENPLDPLGIFPPNYDEPHNDIFDVLLKLNVQFLVSDKYKEQVEKDRKKLELIVMVADFMNSFPEISLSIGDESMLKAIQNKFNLSGHDAMRLHTEVIHMLRNKTNYKKWRIAPL